MQRVRSRIISAPRLSPEVWCAPLGPSGPAASHWLDNSQIQRLDPEKSPENHRRATHITEVGPMKRIPSANYSLSIAVQENALRVTSVVPGDSGAAAAGRRPLPAAPSRSGHQAPMTHQACHLGGTFADRSGSREFSRTRHWYRKLRLNLLQPGNVTKSGRLVVFSRKLQNTGRP